MSDELLDDLNPQQKKAVITNEGPLLLLAGAGSGKTRVLTRKLAYLVREGIAEPGNILAVTFTNKAAQEMKTRVNVLLTDAEGNEQRGLWVMTFHALCVRILRTSGDLIGIPKTWSIVDAEDSRSLVRQVLKERMGEDDEAPEAKEVRDYQSRISRYKNANISLAQVVKNDVLVGAIWKEYEKKLKEIQGLDFDDLLTRTVEVLEDAEGAKRWCKRWSFVLVDEVQDVNSVQDRIMTLLAEHTRNLCVVGDDSQCQPGATLVQTTEGPKRMDELDPELDRITSYSFAGDRRGIHKDGYPFTIAKRRYRGDLVRVSAPDGRTTLCTPDHNWPVRLADGVSSRSGFSPLRVAARDLEPETMKLCLEPAEGGRVAVQSHFTVSREKTDEPVYSIDVKPYHNYFADGFVTYNSIYSFRGAEVEHIMKFKERWPDAQVIKLEHNYRSTPEILDRKSTRLNS